MHDALLIYWMITNMRHAGYFCVATHLLQSATAKWALRLSQMRKAFDGAALVKFHARAAVVVASEPDWLQALTRLESYVASMR